MLLILQTGHLPLTMKSQNTNIINHMLSLIPCFVFSQPLFPKTLQYVGYGCTNSLSTHNFTLANNSATEIVTNASVSYRRIRRHAMDEKPLST